jgi:hypothetical protein
MEMPKMRKNVCGMDRRETQGANHNLQRVIKTQKDYPFLL